MDDIADLKDAAREWQAKEKQKPEGRVEIFRPTGNPSDPRERLTGRPEPKSVADIEHQNPRAHWVDTTPSQAPRAPKKLPPYAKIKPIEGYSATGNQIAPCGGVLIYLEPS